MGKVFKGVSNAIFGKSKQPPQPNFTYGSAPTPSELDDVFDYIAGVKAITATGADGKKRKEIRRLPRTPEEEAIVQQGVSLINTVIPNLNRLREFDPTLVVPFAPLINAFSSISDERMADLSRVANLNNIQENIKNFRTMKNTLIDEEFKTLNRDVEEDLTHRGLSQSTYAAEYKAALGKQQAMARQQGDIMAQSYGEDLADQQLARNSNIFALNEQGRQGRMNAASLDYDLQQQRMQDLQNNRQIAIQDNTNAFGMGAGLRDQDIALAVGSQAPALQQNNYANRLSAFGANVNAQHGAYQAQLNAFGARVPTSQDKLMQLMGTVAGGVAGGGFGGGGGRAMRGGFGF